MFVLSVAIGAVQAFALARGLARYGQRLAVHGVSLDVLAELRLQLFDRLETRVPGARGLASGGVLAGFVSDADVVASGFAKTAGAAVDVTSSAVMGVVLTSLVYPPVGVLLLAGVLTVIATAAVVSRLGRGAARGEAALRSELADSVMETVRSAPELASYGREDLVHDRLADIRSRSVRAARRRALTSGLATAVATVASGATLIAILHAGVEAAHARRLSGVLVAVVVFAAMAVLDQCAVVPAALADRDAAASARERLDRLALLAVPVEEPAADHSPPVGVPVGVVLDRASVEAEGAVLLDSVSFDLRPGERIALVGASGSGKTTVVNTVLHFLRCAGGRVSLGGVDLAEMRREGIAGHLAWVGEDSHLFAASVEENLRVACPSASDAEILGALEQVGLGAWAASLPDGLSTLIGAGGRPVSAGERQRLGLARALIGRSRIMVLDEPTAHLDPSSAQELTGQLLRAAGSRSVLLVSHDPGVRARVDSVLEMEKGRVVGRTGGGRTAASIRDVRP